jgi:hypothetical protein
VAIRLYTLTELAAMLERAGLELLEVHGDLDGGPLELDSSFVVTLSARAGSGQRGRGRDHGAGLG